MASRMNRHRLRLIGASALAVALAAGAAGGAYALTGGSGNDSPKPGAVLAATAKPAATATSVTEQASSTAIAPATFRAQPTKPASAPLAPAAPATDAAAPDAAPAAPIVAAPPTSSEVLGEAATAAPAPTRTPRPESTQPAAENTVAPQPTSTPTATSVPALNTYNMGVRNPDSTCCEGAAVGETFTLEAYIGPRCDGPCAGTVAYQAAEWQLTFNSPIITLVSASPIVAGCTSELDGANGVRITCGDGQQTMSNTGYTFTLIFRCDQPGPMMYSPESAGTRVLVDGEWHGGYLNTVKDFQKRECEAPATATP